MSGILAIASATTSAFNLSRVNINVNELGLTASI